MTYALPTPTATPPASASWHSSPDGILRRTLRRLRKRVARTAVAIGAPPGWSGWRHVRRAAPADWLAARGRGDQVETIHPEHVASNPLPRDVTDRNTLDPDPGWFGFSFRDVPARRSRATRMIHVGPARVVCYGGPGLTEEFHPAVLSEEGTALELDQIIFRPGHAVALRAARAPQRLPRAIWIAERVYDNHSHWLTAHLPKILLLAERGLLHDVVLPIRRTAAIDASLKMLGLEPKSFTQVDTDRPLDVDDLVIVETDRFRPELLRPLRAALRRALDPQLAAAAPDRRVFITREGARGRQLLGEAALRPELEARGFEVVRMETLDFPAQVRLMAETAVLLAPHGAGLTNMLVCSEGTQIAEIADVTYANPNFYALACAMGLPYRRVPAEAVGDGHPLHRDLRADPARILAAADAMIAEAATTVAGTYGRPFDHAPAPAADIAGAHADGPINNEARNQ